MERPETEVVDCDVLIVGGGMAGCGAAYEAAKKAIGEENVYQRVFISHLLKDKRDLNRIAGAVGFFRGSYAIGPCVDNNWLALG